MKNERGSVTLFVLISMIFFLVIAMTAYVSASNKLQGQNAEVEQIKAAYEQNIDSNSLLQLYNKVTKTREWLGGSGTEQDTYKIYTIEDLVTFSIKSNDGDSFDGKYVELMNDLDFKEDRSYAKADRTDFGDINGDGTVETLKTELTTGTGFPCIGSNKTFCGTFLGDEHEIRNIYIYKNSTETYLYLGLFSCIGNNSTIQDVVVDGTISGSVTFGGGGIAGAITKDSTSNIINCVNKCSVSSISASNAVSGIIGNVVHNGTLNATNCRNEGNISGSNNAGGLVGYTDGTVILQNCYNTGEITNNLGNNVGGLIGRDSDATTNSITITNSYNTGNITGKNYAGGIVGRSYGKCTFTNTYNTANVISNTEGATSTVAIYTGGIIACTQNQATITNCYNTGKITTKATSAENNVIGNGGIAGHIRNGTIQNCYNAGKITEGNRVGGIIGLAYGTKSAVSTLKIINSYNTGEVESFNVTSTGSYYSQCAGLLGMSFYNNLSMLNCYNTNKVTSANHAAGIIRSVNNCTANVINCYNQGDIKSLSDKSVAGIISTIENATVVINNSYNTGNIEGTTTAGIARVSSSGNTANIINAYYKNNVASGVVGITPDPSTQMTQSQMQAASFVDTLNSNRSSINLSDYDLSGYTLSSWKTGTSGYPEFDW